MTTKDLGATKIPGYIQICVAMRHVIKDYTISILHK